MIHSIDLSEDRSQWRGTSAIASYTGCHCNQQESHPTFLNEHDMLIQQSQTV